MRCSTFLFIHDYDAINHNTLRRSCLRVFVAFRCYLTIKVVINTLFLFVQFCIWFCLLLSWFFFSSFSALIKTSCVKCCFQLRLNSYLYFSHDLRVSHYFYEEKQLHCFSNHAFNFLDFQYVVDHFSRFAYTL